MRTILAIFVAICAAIWLYASIYIYTCSSNLDCTYQSIGRKNEIITMIAGAFVLGFLFGNIISGYKKKKYIKRSKLDKIQSSYTQSKKYGVHKVVDKVNADQDKKTVDTELLQKIDTQGKSKAVDNSNETEGIFGSLFKEEQSKNSQVDTQDVLHKSEWTKELPDTKTEKILKSDSSFDWNTAPDVKEQEAVKKEEVVKKQEFKIIEDQGEKGFKIKENIQKSDESILKMHQKNVADDLTKIEGIGPKIQELLNAKSLYTFADVAKTDPYSLSDILALAGTRFQMHNPKTWPKQADFASKGSWDELKKYQDLLKGGKE